MVIIQNFQIINLVVKLVRSGVYAVKLSIVQIVFKITIMMAVHANTYLNAYKAVKVNAFLVKLDIQFSEANVIYYQKLEFYIKIKLLQQIQNQFFNKEQYSLD